MATGSDWKRVHENFVKLSIPEAKKLAQSALRAVGYSDNDADTIASHIMDAQSRGYGPAGVARILTVAGVAEKANYHPTGSAELVITRETASSAQLDGKGAIGYLAAYRGTELAAEKAKAGGIGIVGVSNTFYAGMLSYYAELCTRQDLVVMIAASAAPWVAPHGSYTPRFGTNPFCIAFPTGGPQPIIWDIGTSKIIHAQVKLAQLMGEELPEGTAFDKEGEETRDPVKAMQGAMAPWGGHKGSGMAVAIQLLGALAGAPSHTSETGDWGLLVVAMDPEMFRPIEEFKKEVDAYSETIRSSQPLKGQDTIKMPFDRSWAIREKTREGGTVEVETSVVESLKKLVERER